MTPPPTLEIEDVTVQRDGRRLISDVSLAVAAGSLHLLVGPNGAGKSTLFSAILGLAEFRGAIRLNWRGSGRIGYVPQSFGVDRTLPLTVLEFLALSRQRRPVCTGIGRRTGERMRTLLARVGVAETLLRPLGALSGGELQKVLFANAIDPVPELLLLDEPTSGLDESAVKQFEDVLLELGRSARTAVLMVSHDLAQVRRIADQVTLLDGSVRRTGTTALVLADDLARSLAADPGYAAS